MCLVVNKGDDIEFLLDKWHILLRQALRMAMACFQRGFNYSLNVIRLAK
jgi:hypothetical protein